MTTHKSDQPADTVAARLLSAYKERSRAARALFRRACEDAGYKWDTVYRKLKGRSELTAEDLARLGKLLGLNGNYLLYDVGDPGSSLVLYTDVSLDLKDRPTGSVLPLTGAAPQTPQKPQAVQVFPEHIQQLKAVTCRLCRAPFEQLEPGFPPYCENCRAFDINDQPMPSFKDLQRQSLARLVRACCEPSHSRDHKGRQIRFYVELRTVEEREQLHWPNRCPKCGKLLRGARAMAQRTRHAAKIARRVKGENSSPAAHPQPSADAKPQAILQVDTQIAEEPQA